MDNSANKGTSTKRNPDTKKLLLEKLIPNQTDNRFGNDKINHHKQSNKKRLICYSILNNNKCSYGTNCTYSHSLNDQVIDDEKRYLYQIILDVNLMNFFSLRDSDINIIYKQLLLMTQICTKCINNECTGGFNCRNGVLHASLKICKNDLLSGSCLNKTNEIPINNFYIEKISSNSQECSSYNNFTKCDVYRGCINGHHLTERQLVPYYKYVHQKEASKKTNYRSVRYINPINDQCYSNNVESESSSDEEVNEWFQARFWET